MAAGVGARAVLYCFFEDGPLTNAVCADSCCSLLTVVVDWSNTVRFRIQISTMETRHQLASLLAQVAASEAKLQFEDAAAIRILNEPLVRSRMCFSIVSLDSMPSGDAFTASCTGARWVCRGNSERRFGFN